MLNPGLVVESENGNQSDFVPKKGTIDFSINQLFKMDNDRLSDEKICAQIVEVCKNQRAFDKRSVSCDFSLSIGRRVDHFPANFTFPIKIKFLTGS